MADISIVGQLQSYLRTANERATVIASNMANVDTPGYRTQDLNFSQELARTLSGPDGIALGPRLHSVSGLLERPDGNNVDVDRESLLLAETQLQYQAGAQLLKARFHQLLSAINAGGN